MCWPNSPPSTARVTSGFLPKFGVQPAESVRALVAAARIRPLIVPSDDAQGGYRPSAALAGFIGWRDLTCRWPGCDAPAVQCDIDHTVPFRAGHAPVQPSVLP